MESWVISFLPIIVAIIALIGGIIGYLLRYFFDKKKEFASENAKIKREAYQSFVNFLYDVFKDAKKEGAEKIDTQEIKNRMYEFFKKSTLYSSPETINVFGDYMQYLYKNKDDKANVKETMNHLGLVIKVMRKEVGLSNRGLGKNGERVFRAIFRDFDEII